MNSTTEYFKGKRVYITGGSSGIGKATAMQLVRTGAHVLISARGKERLEAALSELESCRVNAEQAITSIAVDVSDEKAVMAAAPKILDALGGLDVLLNNAGVAHVGTIDEATFEHYRRMMDINYFGTVHTTLSFLPHFRKQGHGNIAAVSSTLGVMGLYGYSAYAGSKYAITGFCDCLRQDLLKYGVQVSVLFPADTDTPQLAAENEIKPPETKALAGNASLVSPEFVADEFLAGVAKGQFTIAPGFSNRLIMWAHHKVPWLVRWVIDRDLRTYWRSKGQAAA